VNWGRLICDHMDVSAATKAQNCRDVVHLSSPELLADGTVVVVLDVLPEVVRVATEWVGKQPASQLFNGFLASLSCSSFFCKDFRETLKAGHLFQLGEPELVKLFDCDGLPRPSCAEISLAQAQWPAASLLLFLILLTA
jgi:hypothetical protein